MFSAFNQYQCILDKSTAWRATLLPNHYHYPKRMSLTKNHPIYIQQSGNKEYVNNKKYELSVILPMLRFLPDTARRNGKYHEYENYLLRWYRLNLLIFRLHSRVSFRTFHVTEPNYRVANSTISPIRCASFCPLAWNPVR